MDIKPDFLNWGCWKTAKADEITVIAQRSSLLMSQAWFQGRVGTPQMNRICADFLPAQNQALVCQRGGGKLRGALPSRHRARRRLGPFSKNLRASAKICGPRHELLGRTETFRLPLDQQVHESFNKGIS